jgi:hypothetical protein
MGGEQSSCRNSIHPLTSNDYCIYTIEQLLKEYGIFVGKIVTQQKRGKVFHLTYDVCNINLNYKARYSGISSSLMEVYGEKMVLQYAKRFDKQYNILLNTLRTFHIQGKLVCDEIVLKNKKTCTLLGIL